MKLLASVAARQQVDPWIEKDMNQSQTKRLANIKKRDCLPLRGDISQKLIPLLQTWNQAMFYSASTRKNSLTSVAAQLEVDPYMHNN